MASLILALVGCTPDQGFVEKDYGMIAVVTGDFDAIEQSLNRLLVPYQLYEGYISGPVYEDGPDDVDAILLESEGLFTGESEEGRELFLFDVVFVNSGTRGFGEYVYNGVEPDDALVTDEDAINNVREYVGAGGVLVVSDWAYELIEAAWPDRLDFYGDDALLDVAQAGSVGRYQARANPDTVLEALGGQDASVEYNFSYWTVIEAVGEGVDMHLSADIDYRVSGSEGEGTLPDAPLLVSFTEGSGLVVYSTFHWTAQSAPMADALLTALVEGLPVDSDDSGGATEGTR